MNVPAAGQKIVNVGASGMVGGYALCYALDHPAVEHVTAIGRRKLGISHPKLMAVLHRDFADCSALKDALSGQDAAVFFPGRIYWRGPLAASRGCSQAPIVAANAPRSCSR
jgi:hypothetical protein